MDIFLILISLLFISLSASYGYIMYLTVNKRKNEVIGKYLALSPLSIFFSIIEFILLYIAIFNLLKSDDIYVIIFSLILAIGFTVIFYCHATLVILPDYIKHGNTITKLADIQKVYPTEKKFYTRLIIKTKTNKKAFLISNRASADCKDYFKKKLA